jgi:hypothetical protein
MESDIRYYRRRAYEELGAASRAVTEEARQRRLQLVDLYVQRLTALHEPNPFSERDFARARGSSGAANGQRSAFAWPGVVEDRRS